MVDIEFNNVLKLSMIGIIFFILCLVALRMARRKRYYGLIFSVILSFMYFYIIEVKHDLTANEIILILFLIIIQITSILFGLTAVIKLSPTNRIIKLIKKNYKISQILNDDILIQTLKQRSNLEMKSFLKKDSNSEINLFAKVIILITLSIRKLIGQ